METLYLTTYAQLDGDLYAETEVWDSDDAGERLPGRPGRWRLVARIGRIPPGATEMTESAYERLGAQRRAASDASDGAERALQLGQGRRARAHLERIGVPAELAAVLTPGADE